MHPELEALLHSAEEIYLEDSELQLFTQQIVSLSKRLEIYELLRDRETDTFQKVADRLQEAFPKENQKLLERALRHWILVMRYCVMAMLIDNPEFLQRRLLEWLTDIVKAHDLQTLENSLCQLLQMRLKKILSDEQWIILRPFVIQAQRTLSSPSVLSEVRE
jgi:hypothetical protein